MGQAVAVSHFPACMGRTPVALDATAWAKATRQELMIGKVAKPEVLAACAPPTRRCTSTSNEGTGALQPVLIVTLSLQFYPSSPGIASSAELVHAFPGRFLADVPIGVNFVGLKSRWIVSTKGCNRSCEWAFFFRPGLSDERPRNHGRKPHTLCVGSIMLWTNILLLAVGSTS